MFQKIKQPEQSKQKGFREYSWSSIIHPNNELISNIEFKNNLIKLN